MGRTSKFTFPVPGRKQKPPFGPIVSGPMSKAQKILGTAEINIDAPRQWDSASNSGISVCVSESTATYNASERSRGVMRHEEEGGYAGNNRTNRNNANAQWEQESEIVPAFLTNRFAQLSTEGGQREFTTETSSLARRGSNSTITSWYDKTKMPLSISQQTSSSAMAKGLPQKANAVLDIKGQSSTNVPPPLNLKAKKRPSRLDLGPLLSRARHNSLKGKSDPQRASSVHGHEYTNRSPSLASVTSPKSTPPPIQQRIERKLTRKSTYDSLNSTGSRPRTGSSSRRGANDISTLPNLYEHYEQMSFDQVLGYDGPLAAAASTHSLNSVAHTPLRSPSTTDHQRKNFSRPPLRHEGTTSTYQPQFGPLPESSSTSTGHQQMQPDRDCASSVSSRYTKTSKASKRTSQSLNGSDLMEKSVLSLSSDSEDDFFPDSVSKFTGGSRGSDAGSLAPSSLRSTHSRDAPSLGQGSRKSVKHASFAPTNNTYLTIPSKSPPSKPVSVSSRMSSLPSTTYRPPPAASNRSSQYSTMSTSTTDSLNNSLNSSLSNNRQRRSSYGVQEARVIAVLPPQEPHAIPDRMMSNPPQRMLSTKSSSVHSVDQPTPPMSPTSVESFMSSGGGAAAVDTNNTADSRFMAVTRQEEMLLAALRMKRARMRESILAEYEDQSTSSLSSFHQRNSSQGTITEMEWPEPPQTLRHQTSATSNSTIKAGSRASESRPASLVRGRSHNRSNSRHLDFPAPSSQPVSGASSRTGSLRKMRPVQRTTTQQPSESSKQERILLYLDRPVGNVNSMDFAEPSPDLSDFMDFDNVSEEDDEFTSGMSMFRSRDHHRFTMGSMSSKSRGPMLMTGERVRHESSPLRPRGVGGVSDDDDYNVGSRSASTKRAPTTEIVESDSDVEPMFGIPRPDSPVSPEGTLGLPHQGLSKKKAVRLSAVGNAGVEAGWWGDDG
ncbi:hypothetical protein CSAL01_12945 [Colletotrichum salicis]|uniref:Uncharacterized protein n=1 Tax=Colletotrichum salicis TaxID=1209931 RepID=A0A135U4Y9_9PEZI|nr:hypothetical protein CSAL01_12945 [Colletotrichum salicis]